MKLSLSFAAFLFMFSLLSCTGDGDSETDAWEEVKSTSSVSVNLTSEYDIPSRLAISTIGWEDGINISRDGLNIYVTYMPADLLSFTLNGDSVENYYLYDRGPHYDMDFVTNPVGGTYLWYQSDIVIASRSSVSENFSDWHTSSMKRSIYSEGALTTLFSGSDIDICAFTSNDDYTAQNNIKIITGITGGDPFGIGDLITSIDTVGTSSINTNYIEDNPHIERIDSSNLVLFFDSEDRPGGEGGHDIWYSTSSDNGTTWSTPAAVTSINTSSKEHQPHLYNDGTDWWLYYSAYHTDGKLAIYRAKQQTVSDWDSWGTPELVLSAGNTAGIGEPTLTDNGDLYFVVVYENPDGTDYDKYDADPWVAKKK